MILTESNYFSREAEQMYMGSSQFKSFSRCEAGALAKVNGEWSEPPGTALLVGSYVDAHFSGTMSQFKTQHPEIFKRDGDLKAEYLGANQIIQRIEADPLMMEYLIGEVQTIMTGEIVGVPFKVKFDAYQPGIRVVDLKVVRDFKPLWNDDLHTKQSFVEYWGYDYQGAIYRAVEGNQLPFIIAGATKENEPDIALLEVPADVLDDRLEMIKEMAPRYAAIKAGFETPSECGKCDYCKSKKKLTRVIDYREMYI